MSYAFSVEAKFLNEIRKSANCTMTISKIIYKILVIALIPEPQDTVVAAISVSKLFCHWTADIKSSFQLIKALFYHELL